ncbi:MAG: PIG-L family deacetylase [bacterium]|jgi:LmbE family N-acetylglucosaminyl deacetylase
MKLLSPSAKVFVPDQKPEAEALKRITHLGIGAHQDDLEFMAFHGILECYHSRDLWFGGVTCTNGGGSSRIGPYGQFSDAEMMTVRQEEQNTAATVGHYGVMIQLNVPSSAVKSPSDQLVKNDLKEILAATRPQVVYTHNLADKHDTHLGVVIATIQAIRELPADQRPQKVIGSEIWRGLDWMNDSQKVVMDVSRHENLAAAVNGVFDSQIAGGKRYDLATLGRRQANATFFESHATDKATHVIFGMDLTPLITDPSHNIIEFVASHIKAFEGDVRKKLSTRLGK